MDKQIKKKLQANINNYIKWISVCIIFLVSLYIICTAQYSPNTDVLDIGTFIILAITLIALIFYTSDTNTIALITKSKWEQESILSATYSIEMFYGTVKSDKVLFKLTNPSKAFIKAKVNCNFQVYGESVNNLKAYNGEEIWVLFPHQITQGWFRISDIITPAGKSLDDMQSEFSEENRSKQLTMNLEIEFRDEFGQRRILPKRKHFFDFKAWVWIPELTTSENWED